MSSIEVFDLAATAGMNFPEIGRFAPLALADLVDPTACVHAQEHRILDGINRADAGGPRVSTHAGRLLLDWHVTGQTVEAIWRRRLEWLTRASAA